MADKAANESPNTPIKALPEGATVLPPFAILDECTFFNEKKRAWVKITPERLQSLANKINEKFKKTGELLPIAPGHTKDGVPEEEQPRVIGGGAMAKVDWFVNPRTGEQQDFKALYITPVAYPNETQTFKKLNRGRSVEIWLDPDDISLVGLMGSNAPRRDLGPHLFAKGQHRYRYAEIGPCRFAKADGHDDEPTILTLDDEGKEMADDNDLPGAGGKPTPPKKDNDGDEGGKKSPVSDDMIQAFLAAFLSSDLGKRLEALAAAGEATMGAPGPGAGPIPGAPNAPDAGPTDYDDLFAPAPGGAPGAAPPVAGPGAPTPMAPEPDKKMGVAPVADYSPASGTNSYIPSGKTAMSAQSRDSDLIRMSRLEENNARLQRQVNDLLSVNLQHTIAEELRVLEVDGVIFDYDRELAQMMKLEKKEDRDAHREHMIKFYKRQEDQLPNGGRLPINPGHVASPTRLAKNNEGPTEQELLDAAEEAAKRIYEGGERVSLPSVLAERMAKATQNGQQVQVR